MDEKWRGHFGVHRLWLVGQQMYILDWEWRHSKAMLFLALFYPHDVFQNILHCISFLLFSISSLQDPQATPQSIRSNIMKDVWARSFPKGWWNGEIGSHLKAKKKKKVLTIIGVSHCSASIGKTHAGAGRRAKKQIEELQIEQEHFWLWSWSWISGSAVALPLARIIGESFTRPAYMFLYGLWQSL